jgi:hypothetical protein
MTLQQRAAQLSAAFETRTRNNGDEFTCLKDGAPEWAKDVCKAAHYCQGDLMLPDDWRYSAISLVADLLDEGNDPDEPCTEPDVYTHDLNAWVGSHLDRVAYVDEAIENGAATLFDALAWGQASELHEVWGLVVEALRELDEEDEEDDDVTRGVVIADNDRSSDHDLS